MSQTSRDQATSIRRATHDDIDRLVELCAEHAVFEKADYDPTGKAAALASMLTPPAPDLEPRLRIWVVDEGRGAVGFVSVGREASTWQAQDYLHMDCLYLRPEARNRGLGRALLQVVADKARVLGLTEIQWQTPAWNEGAIRFYRHQGAVCIEKLRFSWLLQD